MTFTTTELEEYLRLLDRLSDIRHRKYYIISMMWADARVNDIDMHEIFDNILLHIESNNGEHHSSQLMPDFKYLKWK